MALGSETLNLNLADMNYENRTLRQREPPGEALRLRDHARAAGAERRRKNQGSRKKHVWFPCDQR